MVNALMTLGICAIWLAIVVGGYIAIYRQLRRRGRVVMLSLSGVIVALIVALIGVSAMQEISAYNAAFSQTRPSPRDAILTYTWPESSGRLDIVGISERDGSIRWQVHTDSVAARSTQATGSLYIISVSAEGAHTIAAYRVTDGALLWRKTTPATLPFMPPLASSGSVIFGAQPMTPGGPATLYALDSATGATRWSVTAPNMSSDQQLSPLAVSDGAVMASSSRGAVSAFRLSDGHLAWERQTTQAAESLNLIAGAHLLYAYGQWSGILALDPGTGSIVWRSNVMLAPTYNNVGLSFSGAYLLTCVSNGGSNGQSLIALDPVTGNQLWSYPDDCGFVAPVASVGAMYVADRTTLVALRASDGASLWRAKIEPRDLSYSSVQVVGGVVLAQTSVSGGLTTVTCPNWWYTGNLFCHSQPYLAAYNSATGARYWQISAGASSSP